MHRDYSCAVIIGRFQPLHNSHVKLIEHALEIADKVLLLVGSSYAARTSKNPFSFEERKRMIQDTFPSQVPLPVTSPLAQATDTSKYHNRIFIEPIRDHFYSDDVWLANVQAACVGHIEEGETVALMGYFKDDSSYYLNLFPQWEFVSGPAPGSLDATKVRKKLFDVGVFLMGWEDKSPEGVPVLKLEIKASQDEWFARNLPAPVTAFLQAFRGTTAFAHLADEFYHNQEYKESWGSTPFPPIFVTADAVTTCSGHVLVIKRGGNPGKGLLALPGGFVRENERIRDAALRELKEETRIKVDKIILESSIVASDVFDYPGRSLRGRTVTHAFHVKLRGGKLPEVKASGADDAKGAFWLPLLEVFRRGDEFFEDHLSIIQRFTGNLGA
ncbi:MAG: bifunctional nicotinamide-nucleotide adenylyltransferase/Nudix hydroxylase [Planctomycetota bacterium]|jgi:bifunctional NMN adenylyltransferase/nudix hydrolase